MNAFAYFNGVPEHILYDNMKTVVTLHSPTQIRFNRKFEEFLAYYGVVPKACKPARPQTKGKVESAVGYLKKNFLQRKQKNTLHEMNEMLSGWLDKVANKNRIKRRLSHLYSVLKRNKTLITLEYETLIPNK